MLKSLIFQLEYDEISNSNYEKIIITEDLFKKMDKTIEIIEKYNPDLIVYPEMGYMDEYDEYFIKNSSGRVVIFGSFYDDDNINKTVIYTNGKKHLVPKIYPSPVEPMARIASWIEPLDFIKKHLKSHTFKLKGNKIYVLNCMEYYHTAYYIARDKKLNKNAIIISPCSNSKTNLFLDETRVIHNHNETIYSIVCNCISKYNDELYADGQSYVYGPIPKQNKIWLQENGIKSDPHNCSIIKAGKKPCYIYMEFHNDTMSQFGRSDAYRNTPNVIYEEI